MDGVGELTDKDSRWAKLTGLRKSPNDNWIDSLNHVWTVSMLLICAIVVTKGQFLGDNIQCWFPAEFEDEWVDYGNDYCWIQNTYYIPMDKSIPSLPTDRRQHEITYYQWVPLILLFQALLFKFPNLAWRAFNTGAGINLEKVVDMSQETQLVSPEERAEKIQYIAKYIDKWLETQREYRWNLLVRLRHRLSQICCFVCNKRVGTYLTSMFLFVRLLYVINGICQFFLLDAFLAIDYKLYGLEVVDKLSQNEPWRESPRFPRITLCDFEIRQLQNIQRYTVQCVLPLNLFNEKIFIFLWFWFFIVTVLSCINLIDWLVLISLKRNRVNYAKKYLKINNLIRTGMDKKNAETFANNYLRDDGVFLLRMAANNSSEMVAADLVNDLWKLYRDKKNPNDITGTRT